MSDRAAIVLPGGRGGPFVPLLFYAAVAAERCGATVHPLEWERVEDIRGAATVVERMARVREQVMPALDTIPATHPLIIAKSLGTYAIPIAADRGLPAIWFTPILTNPEIIAALDAAVAPFLLVGGGADPLWDGPKARALTPHVLEIEDADHAMHVPGPLARSAVVLGRIATAVEEFLATDVWAA
jgi:hypothetical protein